MSLAQLQQGVKAGMVRPQVPLGQSAVNAIILAAQKSKHFPETLKRYLKVQD
jgi:hypothetical protein